MLIVVVDSGVEVDSCVECAVEGSRPVVVPASTDMDKV